MRSTLIISVVIAALSIMLGYRLLDSRRDVILEHFLDSAFNSFACIKFADYTNKTSAPHLIYSNKPAASDAHCLTVQIMTPEGKNALSSLDEPSIIDAYIEGHLDIEWDSDEKIQEKQAIELQQFMYYGNNHYSMGLMSNIIHTYNHWIAQRIQSYKISYDWIDQHYTDGDLIISSFVDDKYTLYSHGIGYGPTRANTADPSKVDCDTLSQDLSLEQSAENKLSFVVENCGLKPGSNVLDVGSGWGAFAKFAVPRGINVRALTISKASVKRLEKLSSEFKDRNVTGAYGKLDVNFLNFWELKDTELGQSLKGTLDAIVCLGTIEHLPKYNELLDAAMFYLKPGGYIHMDGFGSKAGYTTNYFIQKYIYPGDSAPFGASSFFKAWEKSEFRLVYLHCDTENYANTLYGWAKKFERLVRNDSHPLSKISPQSKKIYSLYLWGFTMSFQHPTKGVDAWRVGLQKPLV